MTFSKPLALAGAVAALALVPACTYDPEPGDAEEDTAAEQVNGTLASALSDLDGMDQLNDAVGQAQLNSVFDGQGAYTLLGPTDAAFEGLGERASALMTEEQRPVLVGLLREHILPGHLTPKNIATAIETNGGEVTMTTLGGGDVVFAQDGDGITVSNGNGSTARLTGSATEASNGVIIPLDAVLVPAEAPAE